MYYIVEHQRPHTHSNQYNFHFPQVILKQLCDKRRYKCFLSICFKCFFRFEWMVQNRINVNGKNIVFLNSRLRKYTHTHARTRIHTNTYACTAHAWYKFCSSSSILPFFTSIFRGISLLHVYPLVILFERHFAPFKINHCCSEPRLL